MFAQVRRFVPASFRTLLLLSGLLLFAISSHSNVLAIEDPNVEIPTSPYSERCQRAISTFHQEIDWILDFMEENPDFDPYDPELVEHRDRMWRAWEIAEFECGVDVGGDGEIG
jgi:hypothetical protein